MRKTITFIVGFLVLITLLGAIGANPSYVEELVIGGGTADPFDGGAQFEQDGAIVTSGKVTTGAATSTGASLGIPHGAAPSSPSNGDIWTTPTGLYVRVNGNTVGPLIQSTDVPWGTPGAIGTTTPNSGAFTTLSTTGNATLGGQLTESGDYQGFSSEGLVGLWHCETSPSVLDWSGNGVTGTIGGSGATLVAGKYGTGIQFTATSEMALGNAIPTAYGNTDLSLSLWFKTTANASTMYLAWWFVDSNHRLDIYMNNTGAITAQMKENANFRSIASPVGYNDGKWHHLAFVRDYTNATTNNLTLYLDGTSVGTPLVNVALGDCGGNGGLMVSRSGFGFIGMIDDLSIFSRATNVSEVRTLSQYRGEIEDEYQDQIVGGRFRVQKDIEAGIAGLNRGILTLSQGSSGNTPAAIKLHSPNGTAWHIFVEDDGTLKVHSTLPSDNTNGSVVGLQS